jgi:glycosyltransferase involved in cell wall biosynthesis
LELSIVIPAFNAVSFIKTCLNSIIIQKGFNGTSILLGVDGCPETLKKAISVRKQYPSLRIFWFEQNHGPYIVMNSLIYGLPMDNILIFNIDDIMLQGLLEAVTHELKKHSIVRYCYQDAVGGRFVFPKTTANGTFAIKKSVFCSLNGFRGFRIAADSDFKQRQINSGFALRCLKDRAYFIRCKHPDALTVRKETCPNSPFRNECKHQMRQLLHVFVPPKTAPFKEILP